MGIAQKQDRRDVAPTALSNSFAMLYALCSLPSLRNLLTVSCRLLTFAQSAPCPLRSAPCPVRAMPLRSAPCPCPTRAGFRHYSIQPLRSVAVIIKRQHSRRPLRGSCYLESAGLLLQLLSREARQKLPQPFWAVQIGQLVSNLLEFRHP